VLHVIKYYRNKETEDEALKFAKEVALPYWLSAPGLKEFRGYRDETTGIILIEMEFESYKA